MRLLLIFFLSVLATTLHAGEPVDPMLKALADRDIAIEKAKAVYDKAVEAVNSKLVLDLKAAAKRTGVDKVAIYTEVLKLAPGDAEATAALEKEGKLADAVKDTPFADLQGKAIYKIWNDKGRLDYAGTSTIDVVGGGHEKGINPELQYKYGIVRAVIEVTTPGEYKCQIANYEGAVSVTFAGKKVNWAQPTLLPLQKGKYPLVIELERPRWWNLKFAPKAEASMETLKAPYLALDPEAAKEYVKEKK
jgi:hypothetical protein